MKLKHQQMASHCLNERVIDSKESFKRLIHSGVNRVFNVIDYETQLIRVEFLFLQRQRSPYIRRSGGVIAGNMLFIVIVEAEEKSED